jgi:hypothetical protein
MKLWKDFQPHERLALIKRMQELVSKSPDKELDHETIEQAIVDTMGPIADGVDDNEELFQLVQEVYLDFLKNGAVE